MRIADGVEMLEITSTVMGPPRMIYPALLWDEETAVLVDAGFPGQQEAFRAAIEAAGVTFAQLKTIVLTHQDIDHIGGVSSLQQAAAQHIDVLASVIDKPYIEGEKHTLRFTPEVIERILDSLPPDLPEERRQALRWGMQHPPTAHVDRTVTDGEVLPYCGGLTVIATPGHTPGHLCLYHVPSKTLVTGDALTVVDGQLQRPAENMDLNRNDATRSLQKLQQYDIATLITYHGGRYTGDVNQRIAELAHQ